MHAIKFKNFSTHIIPITNLLLIILIILSILGFIIIFSIWWENDGYEIDTSPKYDKMDKHKNIEEDYREEIIWDEYY
jgi:hypothetical protein